MQKLRISIVLRLFLLLLLCGVLSCKKSFFSKVNDNPGAPPEGSVGPDALLSSVEGSLAYTQGGLSRYTSLLTQQALGTGRQAQAYYQYVFTSADFDRLWGNLYTTVFENNRVLMQKADAGRYNAYSGISRILMAYALQLTVDAFGSVPYSQALRGSKLLQPAYDNDKALYDTIISLADKGISLLRHRDSGSLVPGDEDIIYKGDAARWVKFGHAIKARLYIHQAKNDSAMARRALAAIAESFASNADNSQYRFGNEATSSSPWYQFNEQRGDIAFIESTTGVSMKAANDPRRMVLFDMARADVNEVGLGAYYGSMNAPVEFITYDELMFIKAEAILRTGEPVAEAEKYYRSAVRANMEKLGVSVADADAYLVQQGNLPQHVDSAIKKVAEQEYLALYLNPEAWTLWRRTGYPVLTPVTGSGIPRRLLYPQREYSTNLANVPPSVTLFAPKVFWDK